MSKLVHFFYQNTKKGGVDTFLINLINNWPKKKLNLIFMSINLIQE